MESEALSCRTYRCSKCGVTVMLAIQARRVACWRCRKLMRAVKAEPAAA
jgi:ribosomal protein S27AE